MRLEGHLCVKLWQQHLGGCLAHGRTQEESQAEGMEVGEQREEGLGPFVQLPHPEHALVDVDTDIAVGEGRGLGYAVRPRRVQDDGTVTG